MRFFRDLKALTSGDVVWRSGTISTGGSRYEVIVKAHQAEKTVVLKQVSNGSEYEYATLSPDEAQTLGQALLSGAERCE